MAMFDYYSLHGLVEKFEKIDYCDFCQLNVKTCSILNQIIQNRVNVYMKNRFIMKV